MSQVALNWANQMSANGTMSHNPAYSSQIPAGWSAAAENVAQGYPSGAAVHDGWMASASSLVVSEPVSTAEPTPGESAEPTPEPSETPKLRTLEAPETSAVDSGSGDLAVKLPLGIALVLAVLAAVAGYFAIVRRV